MSQSPSIFNFLERLKMLSSVKRYATIPSVIGESVSEHSFNVAILSMIIAAYEKNDSIDIGKLLKKALLHDFPETTLSDIPHPIKHKFKDGQLSESLKQIEMGLIDDVIFDELPDMIKNEYIELSKTLKDGVEGQIVGAADAVDVVLTSIREINVGNRYFLHVFDAGMNLVKEYENLKFVKLFLKNAEKYKKGLPHIDDMSNEK